MHLLSFDAPEMTILVGGLRTLGATSNSNPDLGVFAHNREALTKDFFVNLLDMDTKWNQVDDYLYEGVDASTGENK
jgi:catalase-peroxidase